MLRWLQFWPALAHHSVMSKRGRQMFACSIPYEWTAAADQMFIFGHGYWIWVVEGIYSGWSCATIACQFRCLIRLSESIWSLLCTPVLASKYVHLGSTLTTVYSWCSPRGYIRPLKYWIRPSSESRARPLSATGDRHSPVPGLLADYVTVDTELYQVPKYIDLMIKNFAWVPRQ